ncbi:MAG: hypothetical protein WCJ30_11175 [Deltaproteobacteria bacterium]
MTDFGVDIACLDDADPRWTTCTGNALVLQDVYHRLTTGSVLGRIINPDGTVEPDPEAENYGDDVRLLVGDATDESAPGLGTRFSDVVQRSKRIDTADCVVSLESMGDGKARLILAITGTSAAGPFSFIFAATSTTLKILSGGNTQ